MSNSTSSSKKEKSDCSSGQNDMKIKEEEEKENISSSSSYDHDISIPKDLDLEMQPKKKKQIRKFTSSSNSESSTSSDLKPVKNSKPKQNNNDHNDCNYYNKRGILKRGCLVFGIILLSAITIIICLYVGNGIFGGSIYGLGLDCTPVPCGPIEISNYNLTSSENPVIVSNYSNTNNYTNYTNSTNSTNYTESYLDEVGRCYLFYGNSYNDKYALCLNTGWTQIYDYECDVEQILNTSCFEEPKGMYFALFMMGLIIFALLLAGWAIIIASPIVLCYWIIDHNIFNRFGKGILISATILVYVFTVIAFVLANNYTPKYFILSSLP